MEWIVEMAGLTGYEDDRTGRLPMGVRQRLALGCALVHSPRVLFLDEPTSGVDPIGRRRFWELLSRLAREEGVAILITTHYLSEAEHCDRLALMYAGRIVAEGTPAHLKTGRAGHRATRGDGRRQAGDRTRARSGSRVRRRGALRHQDPCALA